jgi:uncharacterized membrane protein/glutaredoxin
MRKTFMLLIALLLALGVPASAHATTTQVTPPVVRTVLFYSNGCPYCDEVLSNTLPPIQEKYQSELNILLVEVSSLSNVDQLYALGSALGLTKEQISVPFLLIDHTALIGVDEIKAQLPGLIDKYLASGGLSLPDIPLLNEMLTTGTAITDYNPAVQVPAQPQATTNPSGMVVAWAIMIFMLMAVILIIPIILLAFQGKPLPTLHRWLDFAIPVLAIIGLGAAVYLTYVEITHANALCGPVGDCNAVQSSSYAKLFGVIPIGLVGAVGYIAILAGWLWRRLRSDAVAKAAGPIMFGGALFGTLFSIYLTYLELFVIHAVCIWCLSSAVIITVLMLLCLPYITQWLAISDEEEQPVE